MPKPTQIPIAFDPPQLSRLRHLATESGRSVAALVREAVARYLDPTPPPVAPDSLWVILRDPQHWQTFKQVCVEMERRAQAAASPPEPEPPRPTYRYQAPEGSPQLRARNATPPPATPADDEPMPF